MESWIWEISRVWDEFKADDKVFGEFVRAFHIFKIEEFLLYVSEKIEQLEMRLQSGRQSETEKKGCKVWIQIFHI